MSREVAIYGIEEEKQIVNIHQVMKLSNMRSRSHNRIGSVMVATITVFEATVDASETTCNRY